MMMHEDNDGYYSSELHHIGWFLRGVLYFFSHLKTSNPVIVLEDDEKLILTPDQSLSDCGIGEWTCFFFYLQLSLSSDMTTALKSLKEFGVELNK